ncbi:mannose-1-phosphate guanylyltransferase / mannose-6-phosphate isomerase [Desulfonauticus submarinus]|uniref:mannose-1-phosphate guanylyltransferase n=1 Tax=Desulfonauticus submarinus TaxID=206665 RepID=A0A1H0DM53_9BACT|nr:mannose-1-phosphate guanylyltransferase/mannose-6-phosphate isomerase [Desulfonauticus submarinus]SDN71235.1 mannose-1-phosphate guanylyltransferase / mannose-6-phosphate isomerase [Desulfonauticus submarinus]
MKKKDFYALILAGGSGSRLWPLSRALMPKQLLSLNGERSLLQQTVLRALKAFSPSNIVIITNEEHIFEVKNQIKDICNEDKIGVVAEPMGRNTLPAVLVGLDSSKKPEESVFAVFPSDHQVEDEDAWVEDLFIGYDLAKKGWLVTFGIKPHKPETGYGYIKVGPSLKEEGFKVERFVEKPTLEKAKKFLSDGRYYWNSGMFVFEGKLFLQEIEKQQPELWSFWERRKESPLLANYSKFPDISIDYGIMEGAQNVAVVPASFGWDDLGSWEAIYRLGDKDEQGCVIRGDVLALECENSLLFSYGSKLAAVGLKDLIVVQTRDATLVIPKSQVQKVKDVVKALKQKDKHLVEAHLTVRRPWGSYTILEEGEFYKIKRIEVKPGAKLSLQMHYHRSEHWVVVKGTAEVIVEDKVVLLTENQSIDIPKGCKHRLSNPGKVPVEIIEIQSGPYLEEDDIVRFEDIYGRKK